MLRHTLLAPALRTGVKLTGAMRAIILHRRKEPVHLQGPGVASSVFREVFILLRRNPKPHTSLFVARALFTHGESLKHLFHVNTTAAKRPSAAIKSNITSNRHRGGSKQRDFPEVWYWDNAL